VTSRPHLEHLRQAAPRSLSASMISPGSAAPFRFAANALYLSGDRAGRHHGRASGPSASPMRSPTSGYAPRPRSTSAGPSRLWATTAVPSGSFTRWSTRSRGSHARPLGLPCSCRIRSESPSLCLGRRQFQMARDWLTRHSTRREHQPPDTGCGVSRSRARPAGARRGSAGRDFPRAGPGRVPNA